MALTGRYIPAHPPGESCVFALDYSFILPPGLGITSASLTFFTNTNPANATSDLTASAVTTKGRQVWATVSGGVEGTDYQFRWSATDSVGNVWPRTVLVQCAQTT